MIINNLQALQVLDPYILTRDQPQVWREDIERHKAGKGLGKGESYIPWIGVGEFHSLGEEKLLPGKLVRRLHTTHSQIERAFLECMEVRKGILDIREQFPLPLADTLRIAMDLVIRHPRDYCTKQVRVMTTDFLITSAEGLKACAIKNSQELRKTRTLQKLEMEREYWTRQGIPWKLFTEKEAGISNVRNTAWLAEAMLFHGENYPLEAKKEIQKKAEELWQTPKAPTELSQEIDIALGLKDESLHIIKELIRERAWDWNSYHGLLRRDTFQLEQHWTGELVLRPTVPLTGFECDHLQSDLQKIQLTWDHKRNEKLKRKRRYVNAEARLALPPKPKKEKKVRVKNPKPDPFKVKSEITRPYPDELVWSVLSRYYDETGRPPINTFCTELWGSHNQPGTTSTNFLDKIAKHFAKSLNITEEALKTQHTLCYFETKWGSCPKTRPHVTTHLKSCPECRDKDKEHYGVAYWHRIHQVDGITHCLGHGARLQIAKDASAVQGANRNWRPAFFLPEQVSLDEMPKGNWEVEKFVLEQIYQITKGGQALPWDKQKQSLWGEMERQGYIRGVMVDGWKVLAEAEAKYKDQLKSLFHLENNAWGRRTITNILTGVEPDPHRLMFLHCFLGLPVNAEKPAVKLEPIDGTPRPSRPRVDKSAKERRKAYLVKIKGLKEIEDLPETQAMKLTDPEWLDKLIMSRRKKVEEMKRLRHDLEESLADLIEVASARLKVGEAGLEPVTLERIMREANDRRILLCLKEPMVSKALEVCIDTKDAVIQRRIYWGKENLDTQSYYEFIDKSHLRGIELPEWAMAEIKEFVGVSREENIRRRLEQDEETAKKVRIIAEEFRNRPGRPEWVRRTNLTRVRHHRVGS